MTEIRTRIRALTNPLALATLVGGAGIGVALHSAPLAAVGALTYAALVAWDLLAVGGGSPKPTPRPTVPDPATVDDPELRRLVGQLRAAADERARALADTPDSVATHLGTALATCDDLERNAAVLVARAIDLGAWLATQDRDATRAEAERLAGLAKRTRDPAARAEYERARASRDDHLRALDDVAAARERIDAHLARIASTLAGVPPKLVRMRALDAEAMDLVGTEVARDLATVDREVRLFEQTLESLNQGSQ
ncbi:MAG: hypothetical protein ABMB14_11740 [Myxococcota bacterium]